ncbi:palmitoyltransferase ZDHHC4 isoform X1 [Dromiciops gliroides]|uniref:palmitoyltransferase ZDHHC4 isoform X1 n=2 Tax=Dromiciops gliroides TaxID=33562 RepID=UPI001CC3ACE1|nr:palmitoyltransferase ZDHHC4 isoform X1 [Dromiciops gliroides]XP_043835151.1 palmitoyltransferase ZDHHC4 isoform X1 [Dromiciops gliroides]
MDFLVLFLVYLVCVLTSVLLLCVYSKRTHTFSGEILTDGSQVFSRLMPGWLQRAIQRVFHHLFHTRNCTFIILHLALEGAVYGEYTWEIVHYCLELEFSLYHLLLPYLLLIINLVFFILSCTANPGIITKSNEASFLQVYEYDEVIFLKNMKCPTCHLRKPARSKHCSVCNKCVHRFDHHCIWVNNCIGALNARYFLIYLLTLTSMAVDIAIVTTAFLIHLVFLSGMTLGTYFDDHGQEHPVDIAFLIQYLFLTFPRIVFMLGFVIVLCLLLGGYVCFTLYLAVTNQTSNEWYKSSRAKCHRCHNSDPVQEKPSAYRNIYAKGTWTNLQEIFKPVTDYEKRK